MLGANSVSWASVSLTKVGTSPIPHTQVAWSVGIFLVMAAVFGVVLHATPLGRSMYAIGLQSEAARFAGIRVRRIKFLLFVLSGLVCSFAGILWTLRFATSRYDAGTGLELNVVAIVLFGGVSIFGGRGSIFGVLLAVAVVGCLQTALTLQNVAPEVQSVVTGGLLLISVVLPSGAEAVGRLRARIHQRA
jgi:rhamnose transport system permease protein